MALATGWPQCRAVIQQAPQDGVASQSSDVVNVQPLHDLLPVVCHRFDAEPQLGGDLLVEKTLRNKSQHLSLSRSDRSVVTGFVDR